MKYSARYIDSYARTIAATKRFEDINRNVADEQSKVQYIDSLIQSEKRTSPTSPKSTGYARRISERRRLSCRIGTRQRMPSASGKQEPAGRGRTR